MSSSRARQPRSSAPSSSSRGGKGGSGSSPAAAPYSQRKGGGKEKGKSSGKSRGKSREKGRGKSGVPKQSARSYPQGRQVFFEEDSDIEGLYDETDEEEFDEESYSNESDSEAAPAASGSNSSGGGGSSVANSVVQDLLRRGAVPAVVGKRKRGDDEVEMELFTREAAKKARLIRDEPRRRAPGRSSGPFFGGSFFESFFGM
mmetsp:Transcript_92427/g.152989  ORF Transcript_92427/g.152989 Transcript_92427/m.152989 type:complete len:202 (+) Transcript_92427:57-662(+)